METAATVREWTDLVRRARLGRTTKAVALMLATYADADGTRVFPGLARLAVDCELTYNVVQQALATLRTYGLIHLVRQGTRLGDADEYRLVIGVEVMEHVEVLSPTQVKLAAQKLRERRRGKHQPKEPDDLHPTGRGAGEGGDDEAAPHGVVQHARPAPHGDVHLHPTAWDPTSHDLDTTTTSHEYTDLRTGVEVVDEPEPEAKIIDFPGIEINEPPDPDRCPRCSTLVDWFYDFANGWTPYDVVNDDPYTIRMHWCLPREMTA